ncbi:hypothetical protein SME46J_48530 (plasmid) [Serratia marcescens]|uniref:hypothetical protein n=1 Tax=Serratia marcescens TaxID=615 RepID=UPI0007C96660|nr:hypothetical protein [Serratia marcescens]OAH24271.1 hypothetical protein AYJ10_16980 [Serratia marcescens]BEM90383.1 hypothetical protein SME46J_48530 [Serratia marcescens]
MEDDFFKRESNKLSFREVMERLSELEEDWDRDAPHAGVYRQLKDLGLETLTEKQRWIYENQLKPKSVEKCGYNRTCEKPAYPGKFCDMHELKDDS